MEKFNAQFERLTERLVALQESNAQLKELINRLATIKFQPGSIPMDDDEDNVMTELVGEVGQTIKDQQYDIADLAEDVQWLPCAYHRQDLEDRKDGLVHAVERCNLELKKYKAAFKAAHLAAIQTLKSAKVQERQLLLKSYADPRSTTLPLLSRPQTQKNKELTKGERELAASSDVTLALRRTHDAMASELSRSQFAHDTLKESNLALKELGETYSTLDTMLSSSKNLLGTLLRSQKSDTWYLETAFYVLSATIAWLVWRRLLYGPTWWFVWFPLRMFFKGWIGVFTALGLWGKGIEVASGAPSGGISPAISIATEAASSVVHNKATRAPKVPGMRAPNVNSGGRGKGGPMERHNAPEAQEDSYIEKVGRIIDESLHPDGEDDSQEIVDEGYETGESTGGEEEAPPNPKKRMWEEEKEAGRLRDEL